MALQTTSSDSVSKSNWRTNNKLLFKLFLFSFGFNCLAIIFFAAKRLYYRNSNVENDASYILWRNARTELLESLPSDSSDIVFVGNSITEGFPLQEIFHNSKLKNRGIGYNTTSDVLNRIQNIASKKPAKIFLQIGINDILRHLDIDSVFTNFNKIVTIIRDKSPTTKLYVQPVLPTAFDKAQFIPQIKLYNQKIEDYCKSKKIFFINTYSEFTKNNVLDSTMTYDGVHLKAKGYFHWKSLLEKYINE